MNKLTLRIERNQPFRYLSLLILVVLAIPNLGLAQASAVPQTSSVNLSFNPPQTEDAYRLGSGDRISINIFQAPQYSGEFEVLVNGTVNLPQIGGVVLEGLTLEQAATLIATQYESARILRQPRITVSLVTSRPLIIGIAGEVHRPGSYTLSLEGSKLPTVSRAIKIAGGITQSANLEQVQLRRPRRDGSEEIINVNLWQLLQTGNLSYDSSLRDGDTIFIPTMSQIDPVVGSQLANASFAADQSQPISIAVGGEVQRPGPYVVAGTGASSGIPTITQAIQQAGGVKLMADIRSIQIRRITNTGFEQTLEVDLMPLLEGGDLGQDILLQEGDSIFVPSVDNINLAQVSQLRTASFAASQTEPLNIAIIGEVFRPGPYTVTGSSRTGEAGIPGSGANGNTPPTVTRAIQVAGGIKPLADIRSIEIRRVSNSGLPTVITINLWELLKQGDATQDTILQEGDTVFVPTATEVNPEEIGQIAEASFAPNTIRVNIVGEVQRPGLVEIPPNTPLNEALLRTGGFNSRANEGLIELIRYNPNGTVEQRRVQLDFTQNANEQTNPILRNNDVVIVTPSTLANISDTVDKIVTPLNRIRSLFVVPSAFIDVFRNF
ncbi:SLBB domain-containing protein [Lyngbya sp. PCC 8106]|uniref:SLBB domain-containing protein n=1 Tax=Lyngbya sp. (strain PCC 8106) TaxID=313612 RepID=UPI0000EACDD2|nr:SLBB domain-containing protein [Lyngbya sp. PCC 8106]EAW35495.1 Polysaccharide export protein [Lyngbya sp. PCC 8106]